MNDSVEILKESRALNQKVDSIKTSVVTLNDWFTAIEQTQEVRTQNYRKHRRNKYGDGGEEFAWRGYESYKISYKKHNNRLKHK